jgi:hypothetical protein
MRKGRQNNWIWDRVNFERNDNGAISRRLNCSTKAVAYQRKKRNIDDCPPERRGKNYVGIWLPEVVIL